MSRPRRRRLSPEKSAEHAGLRYVSVREPGITRLGSGKGFRYVAPDGTPVKDAATLERIRKLAIPPAYRKVWICADPDGHIQAVGTDAAGRQQYRYHPQWHSHRGETKFHRTLTFGRALPKIRAAVERDLQLRGMPREKVLATIVALLERTQIRVGNEEYAKTNEHYGLTTLRADHADVAETKVRFLFKGKSGVDHDVVLRDRRLARIIAKLEAMEGQELFHFQLPDGSMHKISSGDVNRYIKDVSEGDFTAKDFRTWAGTVIAAESLAKISTSGQPLTKRAVAQAVKEVAAALRNTPLIARSNYIHPGILQAAAEGTLPKLPDSATSNDDANLSPTERKILRFLSSQEKTAMSSTAP